ncbi:hypothetical protein E2P81_ATG07566 [Venturia nashicola]|nr:hypothetical protein E2P81_ATG07566 [Venturia nashicola]
MVLSHYSKQTSWIAQESRIDPATTAGHGRPLPGSWAWPEEWELERSSGEGRLMRSSERTFGDVDSLLLWYRRMAICLLVVLKQPLDCLADALVQADRGFRLASLPLQQKQASTGRKGNVVMVHGPANCSARDDRGNDMKEDLWKENLYR